MHKLKNGPNFFQKKKKKKNKLEIKVVRTHLTMQSGNSLNFIAFLSSCLGFMQKICSSNSTIDPIPSLRYLLFDGICPRLNRGWN